MVKSKGRGARGGYDESNIKVLKGLEAVRTKPAMYIGPTDSYGIFTIIREPADNYIDEFEAGRATEMTIRLRADGYVEVHDDGNGMPVGIHKTEKIPTLEVLVSMLHAGGKLEASDAYAGTRGTHGVGVKATNALSERFAPYTYRDGKWWTIGYERGKKVTDFREISRAKIPVDLVYRKGTIIVFKPDMTIFDRGSKLDPKMVHEWAETAAYLSAGAKITVDEAGKLKTYQFENGIDDWLDAELKHLKATELGKEPIRINTKNLDLVLTFTDAEGNNLSGYCNGLFQSAGGNHVITTLKLLAKSLDPYCGSRQDFTETDLAEGLLGIVNFKVESPKFSSQDKIKLVDSRFEELNRGTLTEELARFWTKNKGMAKEVIKRASELRSMKQEFAVSKAAARQLKDRARDLGRFPGKLARADGCRPDERELFVVEGDSAGGSARGARMSKPYRYQETLALKGKPANAYKTKNDKLLASEEVLNVLIALGFNPDSKDPMSSLRVGKIILLSDPDPDGYHINSLVLALLAKMIPGVFARGMVYTVVSPKYYLKDGQTMYFGLTLDELRGQLPKGVNIERASYLKGWGEASVTAMRSIAFDPDTRRLVQIAPPDKAALAEFEQLMGDDPTYRRDLLGIS